MNGVWVFLGAALIAAALLFGGRYATAPGNVTSTTEYPVVWILDRWTGGVRWCSLAEGGRCYPPDLPAEGRSHHATSSVLLVAKNSGQ
jgi:hypothetical protein